MTTAGAMEPNRDPGNPRPDDEISLLHLLSVLLRRRYAIAAWTIGTTLLVVAYSIFTFSPTYTSDTSFIPQGAARGGGELRAMAGRFGVSVPSEGASESPAFYSELLRSREILRQVLGDTFAVNQVRRGETVHRTGTVLELNGIESEDMTIRRDRGVRWLRNAIATTTRPEIGSVTLSVTTAWPEVSAGIARRLVTLVNDFNLQTRQSQAAAERTFTEERLSEARDELLHAENELKRFLEANRQFENSPELLFEYDRLGRQVALRQDVVASLSQSYEQARITEVRNLPIITVVEPPEEPVQRDPRGLALRAVLGLMLGGVMGVSFAFGREVVRRRREAGDPMYQEFHEVWEETLNDLGWPRRRKLGPGSTRDGEDV